jgi:hypothetical protein
MHKFICLLVFIPGLAGADPAAIYQPLAFLAGHCWTGAFPGGKQTDTHCFSWIYGGEYLYIESGGGFSRGAVTTDADSLLFPDTTFVENGETQVYRSRWRHSTETAYDVVTEIQAKNNWMPGFTIRMERAGTP